MSLYVRLYVSYFSHRKTRKLRSLIGDAALWLPPRLWTYAAVNQPDGNFSEYSADDIAEFVGYKGDAQALLEALLQAQFLDADLKIHDWAVHSGFHELYAARAKKAAAVRWSKERTKEIPEQNGTELSGAELSKHSSNNASSIPLVFDRELENRIKRAEKEIEKVKCRGILKDSDWARIKELKGSIEGWNNQLLSRK